MRISRTRLSFEIMRSHTRKPRRPPCPAFPTALRPAARKTHVFPDSASGLRPSHRRGRCAAAPVPPTAAQRRPGTRFTSACDTIRNFRTVNGACRLAPVPLVPASFPRLSRTKAPSLRRHYPASSVLRASPPPCRPKLALAGFRLARARHRQGFPCCSYAPLARMLPPIPRRRRPACLVRAHWRYRSLAAFPETTAGRPPHHLFRGLLGVHSHCGLRAR